MAPMHSSRPTPVAIANPLAQTFAHFVLELRDTLDRCNVPYTEMPTRTVEGLVGTKGKLRMLLNALRNDADARHEKDRPTIQLWPSLGLLEMHLLASRGAQNYTILHDPVPIRRQVGYGAAARALARSAGSRSSPAVIVHSADAHTAASQLLPKSKIVQLRHPIRSAQSAQAKSAQPEILVAGQYKPERNLELLASIGPKLRSKGIKTSIVGRGWSGRLEGWEITDEFVPDTVLDQRIGSAWAVLIPYNRYFQSGIAVRALELGTVSIGARNSFLTDLMGADNPLLAEGPQDTAGLLNACLQAAENPPDPRRIFADYRHRTDAQWSAHF